MKFTFSGVILALGMTSAAAAKDGTYQVVPEQSSIIWTGSKLVGSGHTGKVSIKEGSVSFLKDKVKSGKVVVDLTSIVNTDLKDPKWNQKLVEHLKSPDFFDVEKHKTAELEIKKVTYIDQTKRSVEAFLTVKGKRKPVQFEAQETDEADGKTVRAELVFDRTEYDVRFNSTKFFSDLGDKVIKDDIKLQVELRLKP